MKYKRIPLLNSIEFGMPLKKSAAHYKQKTEILFAPRPPISKR